MSSAAWIGIAIAAAILLAAGYFGLPNLLMRRREVFCVRGTVLTFDDGPDPEVTPEVLRLLKRYNRKAVFFLVGEKAERYPELVDAIIADGHEIGIHAYRHAKQLWLSPRAIRADLSRCLTILRRHTDRLRRLRPPHGLYTWTHIRFMKEHGLLPTHWYSLLGDWRDMPTEELARRYESVSGDGRVIVLHDGTCGAAERAATLKMPEALALILEREQTQSDDMKVLSGR